MCQVLIDAGADIETKDDRGRSPLHLACRSGALAVVKMLVKAGVVVCGTNATLLQTDFQCCKRTSVRAVWSAWMHSLSSIPKPICVVSTYGRSSARHSSWFPLHASCTASKATVLLSVSGMSFSSPTRTAVVSPFLAASTKTSSAESFLLFGAFSSGVLSACRFDMVLILILFVGVVR